MRHLCILSVEVPQCHMLAVGETSSLKSVKVNIRVEVKEAKLQEKAKTR